jgi:DNA-binding transcriptional MerR regulator
MKNNNEEIEKKYYSIGEVAQLLAVAPSLIRFWESQFDAIKPRKNKKGVRQYTKDDIEKLQMIYFLVKAKGMTLQGAREILSQKGNDSQNVLQVLKDLQEIKLFLANLKNGIEKLA